MEKHDAITKFVKDNYQLLKQQETFDKTKYAQQKINFFGKNLKHKFGLPNDKEICDQLVEVLIKNEHILEIDSLAKRINEIPFLRLNNVSPEKFSPIIDAISKLNALDEGVGGLRRIEKIERELEYVKKEHTRELDDAIVQKKEEYRQIQSVLDDIDVEEPEPPPKPPQNTEWWQDIGLRENPFQGPLDGFCTIDKSLYKQIIVQTEPIIWGLKKLSCSPSALFHKGYLLAGAFGTGKTTFFDFMAPHLTIKKIEPIRIALTESMSEAHYVDKFEKEICLAISQLSRQYGSRSALITDFSAARMQMQVIQHFINGFLIFIDDLHKHANLEVVFSFLSHLQIIKNNFSRDGINVVFIVAGFPDWRKRIKQESALTGFFDASDELNLPEVTPSLAAEAINLRLKAYALNPEKDLEVKQDFLAAVFKKVHAERKVENIGFRPYIQEALQMFEQRQFNILSVNIATIEPEVSNQIREDIEADQVVSRNLNKLLFGGGIQKQSIRDFTLRVLCEIYLQKGIGEDSDFFLSRTFSFKRLIESGLIQKYKRVVNGDTKLIWNLQPELLKLNTKIIEKHNLSIEDYLIPIYSTSVQKPAPRIELTKDQIYQNELREWQSSIGDTVYYSLNKALNAYSKNIFSCINTKSIDAEQLPSIPEIKEPVWTMMKSIIRFESPTLLDIYGENDIEGWYLRHRSLECSQHFINLLRTASSGNLNVTSHTRLISFADEAFTELWNDFKESLIVNQKTGVTCYMLPKRTLKCIFSEYSSLLYLGSTTIEYFNALDRLVDEIEQTIRSYLLTSCLLIFGDYPNRLRHYPEDIRKYITRKSPPPSSSEEGYNEFENLNRGNYRTLFRDPGKSTSFYKHIIKPITIKWDVQDLDAFFEIFGDMNIITSHRKTNSSEGTKKDVPTFLRLSCRLIAEMSERLRNLLLNDNVTLIDGASNTVVFGISQGLYSDMGRFLQSTSVRLPEEAYEIGISSLLKSNAIDQELSNPDTSSGFTELDMLDVEGTIIKFGNKYADVIALFANQIAKKHVQAKPLYGASVWLKAF